MLLRLIFLWAFSLCCLATPNFYTHNSKKALDYVVKSLPGLEDLPYVQQPDMYAGQIQISQTDTSKIFFWLFQLKTVKHDKLVIWLNGGPGCSSMDGALMEIGPLRIGTDGKVKYNNGTWLQDADILFIDQPKGTGLSTTNGTYTSGLEGATAQFLTFYSHFLKIFEYYTDKDIYLAGESYAGQFIPYFAKSFIDNNHYVDYVQGQNYLLHDLKAPPQNQIDEQILNSSTGFPSNLALNKEVKLKGLLIGNGWIYPDAQALTYVAFGLDHGLLSEDNDQMDSLYETFSACETAMASASANTSLAVFSNPICTEEILTQFLNITKKQTDDNKATCYNMYNYNIASPYPLCGMEWPPDLPQVTSFLQNENVLDSLNVEKPYPKWTECSGNVSQYLVNYNTTPSFNILPKLLESVPVVLYNGNYDIICNHAGIDNLTSLMTWNNQTGFSNDTGYIDLILNDKSFGRAKYGRQLTLMEIYNASHMVPFDHSYESRAVFNYMIGNYKNISSSKSNITAINFPDLSYQYDLKHFNIGFVVSVAVCLALTWAVVLFLKFTNKSNYLRLETDDKD